MHLMLSDVTHKRVIMTEIKVEENKNKDISQKKTKNGTENEQ